MQTQVVFQAGNSLAVVIPKHLMKDLKFQKGQKVTVDKSPDGETLVISKSQKTEKMTSLTPEFKKWLDNFMIEYKPILKKLANL